MCRVIEPSSEAVSFGQSVFPAIEFQVGSICSDSILWKDSDLVLVSGVFCWVDRHLLSRAVCNVDSSLKNGGMLVISDFDSPSIRANPYKHCSGLFTYKLDYTKIFTSLGSYHLMFHRSENLEGHSKSDETDSYDRQWSTSILRKDVTKRYFIK